MYAPHLPNRQKKRPIHGLKTVDVTRGKSGYGFTISGQHPCVLSCITTNSPAERVGLCSGDYLMSVNGIDISKHGHDDVVRMVGMSTGTLTIQVAENCNSSDSSDDEFYPKTWAKYSNRPRKSHKGYGEKMAKLFTDNDRPCPDGRSHDPTLRPLPKVENKYDFSSSRSLDPKMHLPVGEENYEIKAIGTSYIEAGDANLFKVPFQKSVSASNVAASRHPMHRKIEPRQAFIKSTSQTLFRSLAGSALSLTTPSQHNHFCHTYEHFSPNSLQQIINQSLHSYSEANEAFILNEDDIEDNADSGLCHPNDRDISTVVGYVGTLEMPGDASHPHVRIQSIRNAVRQLRLEQKIHTLVLMIITPNLGVKLIDMQGKELAYYPVGKLAFSGVCPDDNRFFAVVTRNISDGSNREELVGSSCHVFVVDQDLAAHNIHAEKAKSFGIECTVDPLTQHCMEFPCTTTPIILSISDLYKERLGCQVENDVANPDLVAEHIQTSSQGDSGLGLCKEDNQADRVPPPVLDEIPPPPLPPREHPVPKLPQLKGSGNTMCLIDGPAVKHAIQYANENCQGNVLFESIENSSSSSEEYIQATDQLNIHGMRNISPNPNKNLTPHDGLEQQNAPTNLRMGTQKLLQARQIHGSNQTNNTTESHSLRSGNFLCTSEVQARTAFAPLKYLSNESLCDLNRPRSDLGHLNQNSESSLADQLSPMVFLSSAFTPVGSVGSAFTKSKSKSHVKRSPSASYAPNYHGDDEDSHDEAAPTITKRFQKDGPAGEVSVGSTEPRKLADNITYVRKRDHGQNLETSLGTPDSAFVKPVLVNSSTEKWTTKCRQSSLRLQQSHRFNSLSQSHELLTIVDQEPMPQKLTSACSINNIVNHVARSSEQDEADRVAGWAVSFEKLLKDAVGNSIFTNFLKMEFSEENVEFWKACEDFKNIVDSTNRKFRAKEIYDKYVSVSASECINIDSLARRDVEKQLDNPTPHVFNLAQQQIYLLMKLDSYARFLKSDSYKTALIREMEGKPLQFVEQSTEDKLKVLDNDNDKEGKKKGKGKENEEKHEKRRRSLLPWKQKSKKHSKPDFEAKNTKSDKDNNTEIAVTKVTATAIIDSVTQKEVVHVDVPETIDEDTETDLKFCRVIMPDGSTTVVGTRHGQTINYILGKLCEKRGLTIANVDVLLLDSDKPLNLEDDISTLGSKEVYIEQRVFFRMDLPDKKSIGVKVKPNKLIKDAFQPILQKYGYTMESTYAHLFGKSECLCLDSSVSSLDGQRVIMTKQPINVPDGDSRHTALFGFRHPAEHGYGGQMGSFHKGLFKNREEQADEEAPKQAHDLSLVDQLGLAPQAVELSDVLQGQPSNLVLAWQVSAPAAIGRDIDDSGSVQTKDDISQIDDYVEDNNDNFAVYTRGNNQKQCGFFMDLQNSDKVLPSNSEAANFFDISSLEDVHFTDSHLTDKRLSHKEFTTLGHNKHLVKSRNFEDQRQKQIANLFVIDNFDVPLALPEMLSPSEAPRKDLHNALDVGEVTIVNCSDSSLYISDAKVNKENINKVVPKSKHENIHKISRHTFLHSSCTLIESESLLSTVDTDGRFRCHSTPVNMGSQPKTEPTSKIFNASSAIRNDHANDVIFF